MSLHDVINTVCADLASANDSAEFVTYGGWVTSENGTATVKVVELDLYGQVTATYALSLALTKEDA